MSKHPITMAVRALRAGAVEFVPHQYKWEPHGGTAASAAALGVDEHAVIKTLIMETDARAPLCVLMHGDREASTKKLARALGVKTVTMCAPEVANRHSGYQVGGTSPFGLKHPMPVYVHAPILELPRIWINGGARGFLVEIDPRAGAALLRATACDAAAE